MKIGLFVPCYVDALYPEVGVSTYRLLKSLGLDVDYPERQTCCGQPMGNAGFEQMAEPLVKKFDELFAVPIKNAFSVAQQLMDSAADYSSSDISSHGSGARPWLGLSGATLTRDRAMDNDIKITSGVFVTQVVEGSPASRANIKPGDTVSALDGVAVNAVEAMVRELNKHEAGDKIKLTVWRNNKKFIVTITLDAQ